MENFCLSCGHNQHPEGDCTSELRYCENCGKELADEEIKTTTQPHPYGMGFANETLVVGYDCDVCGHKETF